MSWVLPASFFPIAIQRGGSNNFIEMLKKFDNLMKDIIKGAQYKNLCV